MAEEPDPQHTLWLYDGLSSWNAFRRDTPDLIPLLDGVQLPPPGAPTSLDDPYDMSLHDLDLHNAQMRGARIDDVNLARSSFAHADLTGARLTGCSLIGSSLQGAKLIGAEFTRCDLEGADLSGATFGGTRFIGVDLAGSTGQATTSHTYASIVDTQTFEMTSASVVQDVTRFAVVSDFLAKLGLSQDLLDLLEIRAMEAGL